LPKELEECNSRDFPVVVGLRNAAILKLWYDRGFRDISLNVFLRHEGKRFYVKLLAKNKEGKMFGVECASTISLGRLRKRIERLRACLPPGSYIIIIFPYGAGRQES